MDRQQIIDSTTITLFSNLIFKGVGRHPKTGKKKGGLKVHTVIHANEGVPSDVKFTSAATNDSFMLKPSNLNKGDIMAMDRAYVNYEKFEGLTQSWKNLTNAQLLAWNALAQTQAGKSVLGTASKISGANLYTR